MKLLYVADNGFKEKNGKYYYSKPNAVNAEQYRKYFDDIYYLARKTTSDNANIEIPINEHVVLIGKRDVFSLRKEANKLLSTVDAVIFRNGINGCLLVGLAKKKGVVIISYNGADPYEFQIQKPGIKGKIIAPIWKVLEKRRMRMADYAHYCAGFLRDKYPCNGKSLICSNVSIEYDERVLENRISSISNKKESQYRIGLIGQLNDNRKGIEYAIKSIGILVNKGIDVVLEVTGAGKSQVWKQLAEKLGIEEKILFKGYISSKEVLFSWLDDLDIYIQPSLCEGLPRATVEAMSRACPVIATRVDAIPEIIGEEALVSIRSEFELAERIEWLIINKEKRIEQAKKNFCKTKEFRTEIRDKKLDDFYTMIVNSCLEREKKI